MTQYGDEKKSQKNARSSLISRNISGVSRKSRKLVRHNHSLIFQRLYMIGINNNNIKYYI